MSKLQSNPHGLPSPMATPVSQPLHRAVQGTLPSLIQQIRPERTVPSQGTFQPVFTILKNPDERLFAGRIHFIVRSDFDEPELRYFDIRVETPSGKSHASVGYPFIGTKAEVLRALEAQLADPSVLVETIRQGARILQEADKA
jgi:hypothetical protein